MRNKQKQFILMVLLLFIFGFILMPINKVKAATFSLSPSSGSFGVGKNFSVSLYVNSGGKAINGATAQINFPANKLSVVSVSSGGSIINFWAEAPAFNNSTGKIVFSGVALNPGFNGSSGRIVKITFKVKDSGKINLSLSAAQILANDGLGTNIFSGAGGAQFSLITEKEVETVVPIIATKKETTLKKEPESPKVSKSSETKTSLVAPLISSETHPQAEIWYNNNNPAFSWKIPTGTKSIGLVIDNNSETIPEFIAKSLLTKYKASNVMDGTWYLHAQFLLSREWTKIAHFRFNIDTTPPELTDVSLIALGNVKKMLKITAVDRSSGIAKYTIKINDGQLITLSPEEKEYSLDYLAPGTYQAVVSACDLAGNCSMLIKKFNIVAELISPNQEKIDELKIIEKNLYTNLIIFIIFVILLFIYLFRKSFSQTETAGVPLRNSLKETNKLTEKSVRKKSK